MEEETSLVGTKDECQCFFIQQKKS